MRVGKLRAFANGSVVQNEMVDPDEPSKLSGEVFTGYVASAGVDFDWRDHDGVGVQYAWVQDQQGFGSRTTQHFVNVGATHWVTDNTAVGGRVATFVRCTDPDGNGCPEKDGETSYFVTVRTLF
jgi:hypothetical protein